MEQFVFYQFSSTRFCIRFYILACLGVYGIVGCARAQLPQDEPWQAALYDWMGGLETEDFSINRSPLIYKDSFFNSADELYRMWLLTENEGRTLPSAKGLRTDPSHFTLRHIERDSQVHMDIGPGEFIDPLETAWWAGWDYPGNPYRGSRAVKLRALVAAGVDMMMLDELHDSQHWAARSDYLGGSLIRPAYAFWIGKDVLPADVRAAYGQGLQKMFGKLEAWGPTGNTGDMDQFALVSMWYIADALDDDDLRSRARAYASRVYDELYRPAGYIEHGDGFDGSYQGITFFFDTWAGLLSGNQEIINNIKQMARLKAHLTLPDPDGNFWGPSHFATANDAGSPNDQWAFYQRDIATAMLTEEAKYLIKEGRVWPPYYTINVQNEATMREEIRDAVTGNMSADLTKASEASPKPWSENHWISLSPFFAYDYYRKGLYDEIKNLQGTPVMDSPFKRNGPFIEQFGEDFLVVKTKDYGAVIHTGRLSSWGSDQEISGFGGGALSAFWTPATGSVVLGKQKGFQADSGPDTWDEWRIWPTHSISGQTSAGKPFSSARQRTPAASYQIDGDSALVEVNGNLDDAFAAPGGALSGSVNYKRLFEVLSDKLRITSEIEAYGGNQISELYEVIPVFLYDSTDHGHGPQSPESVGVSIEFLVGKSWLAATTSLQNDVSKVRITRFEGSTMLEFDSLRNVKLSPEEWSSSYQTRAHARNILVDLKQEEGDIALDKHSVSYTLSALEKGDNPRIDLLPDTDENRRSDSIQNYPNPFNSLTTIEYFLNEESDVEIEVYNTIGQSVATLVDEVKHAGPHKINFSASGLTSGVYFCHLTIAGKTMTKKMIYIK